MSDNFNNPADALSEEEREAVLERFKKVLKEKANGALAFGEVSLHGYTMVRIASKKRVDAYCMPRLHAVRAE